jgi:hypothetical protein
MAESQPFSIRIFVADGDPDGLRVIERFNWNGKALVIPAYFFRKLKNGKSSSDAFPHQ